MSNPNQPLVLCFLGSWQIYNQAHKTNTARIYDSVKVDPENKYLSPGIGTRFPRVLGGAFGWGVRKIVDTAVDWVLQNIENQDQGVCLFGFSRGATEARWVAGELGKRGVRIQYLGVFDTVGALGIPARGRWLFAPRFPDCIRGTYVQASLHLLALNEQRKHFPPTLWQNMGNPIPWHQQIWLPGVHADIGGGNGNHRKNLLSLAIMLQHAHHHGHLDFDLLPELQAMTFNQADIDNVSPPPRGFFAWFGLRPRTLGPWPLVIETITDLRIWIRTMEQTA